MGDILIEVYITNCNISIGLNLGQATMMETKVELDPIYDNSVNNGWINPK
jgi:hypothetical protein